MIFAMRSLLLSVKEPIIFSRRALSAGAECNHGWSFFSAEIISILFHVIQGNAVNDHRIVIKPYYFCFLAMIIPIDILYVITILKLT